MGKYIHLFDTASEFNEAYNGDKYLEPWVSLTEEGEQVKYNKTYREKMYGTPLTFVVNSPGNICWKTSASDFQNVVEYSKNDGEWTTITASTEGVLIPVVAGDKVAFRGTNASYHYNERKNFFSGTTCEFDLEGNIMSMINKDNFATLKTFTSQANFRYFFQDCTGLASATYLILPATVATTRCYQLMFQGCTSLVDVPSLPDNLTLDYQCLSRMYDGCTSLRSVPLDYLPYETLSRGCYTGMFQGCTQLEAAPMLNATSIPEAAYDTMFKGCTSLSVTQDVLPATTVALYGYSGMFEGCTSLTKAPNILATEIGRYAFKKMFASCTNLVTGPEELYSSSVPDAAYNSMFISCTSLEKAPAMHITSIGGDACWAVFNGCTSLNDVSGIEINLDQPGGNAMRQMFMNCSNLTATPYVSMNSASTSCMYEMFRGCSRLADASRISMPTVLAANCCLSMFNGCSSLTVAPELPALTLATSCYNSMFDHCTSLTTAPELPAETLVDGCYFNMFKDCSSLNYIKCLATDASASQCTSNWVFRIPSTGTFVKNPNMSSWTTGNDGIPTNWTVQDA